MIRFKTRNSCYEINTAEKLIRRTSGVSAPTVAFGSDGEWRPYEVIYRLHVGEGALIVWPGAEQGTQTSVITEVDDDSLQAGDKEQD